MTDVLIFSIGSVLFIVLTGATILFLYFRFSELYRVDQAADPAAPVVITDGATEVFAAGRTAPA
jgi:hypothetical protein